jgi:hypothetical protein
MDFPKTLLDNGIKRVKIDIGLSYNAPVSQVWLSREPDLVVFGFEPNPDNVRSILSGNNKKRHGSHGDPINHEYIGTRFFLIPVALNNVTQHTKLPFYCTSIDSGTSSLHKPVDPRLGSFTTVEVDVFPLSHFFDLFPWDRFPYIECIKIDAQGSDLDIIRSAGHYLKERVVYVIAEPETDQYENCSHNNMRAMLDYLEPLGFFLINHPNTNDPTFLNSRFNHLKNEIFICQIS